MAEKYRLYYDEIMEKKDLVDKEEPFNLEVFDAGTKQWIDTKSLVSQQPREGWEPVSLIGLFGNIVEGGKFYLKIVEELLSEDED